MTTNRTIYRYFLICAILLVLSFQAHLWFDQLNPGSTRDSLYNSKTVARTTTTALGSIIPYELSINHLKLIIKAPGAPLASSHLITEEFLPVVLPTELVLDGVIALESDPKVLIKRRFSPIVSLYDY